MEGRSDAGPGGFDEHLPIPSTGAALARLVQEDWRSGGLTLIVLLGSTRVLGLFGAFGVGLGVALVAGYLFSVLGSAAHGHPRLPDPRDFEGLESWIVPLGQAAFATAPAIGLVLADYLGEGPRFLLAAYRFDPPFTWTERRWLLAAVGLAFAPPGLVTTAVTGHPLAAFHVPLNLRFAIRMGRDLVFMVVSLWLAWLGVWAASAAGGTGLFGFVGFLADLAALIGAAWVAFALGWAVYRRADDFGIQRRPEHVRRRSIYEPPTNTGARLG